ncbi:MAG TPA: DUF1326 domain-containing protein [Gemmataceae bacterium]|jgi:hypothetical protein|nr:DUF1326 domain-containing protein [Gemmataceae bacterium]
MTRFLFATAVAFVILAAPAGAAELTGKYVEARTCDVYTAPCFANAEMNLTGKHAVMGWRVDHGAVDGVTLDGLSVVAIVAASDTLGLKQTGPAKSLIFVDAKATSAQRDALVQLARREGGDLIKNVIGVDSAPIELSVGECKEGGCASLVVGKIARIETRCVDAKHDKICGNESAFYPPLSKDVEAQTAVALEHSFQGKALNQTWNDAGRRGAYVGSFAIR